MSRERGEVFLFVPFLELVLINWFKKAPRAGQEFIMSRRSSRLSHGGSDDGTPLRDMLDEQTSSQTTSQDKDARGGGGALSAELKRMRTDDQFVSADLGDGGARSARTRKAPTLFQAGQEAWPTARPSRSRNDESEDESEEDESDEEEEGEENVCLWRC